MKKSLIFKRELTLLGGIFDYDLKAEQLVEVERELEQPDVWNDPERAQNLGKQRSDLELVVNTISTLDGSLVDTTDLLDMAVEENDEAAVEELQEDLAKQEQLVKKLGGTLKVESVKKAGSGPAAKGKPLAKPIK